MVDDPGDANAEAEESGCRIVEAHRVGTSPGRVGTPRRQKVAGDRILTSDGSMMRQISAYRALLRPFLGIFIFVTPYPANRREL